MGSFLVPTSANGMPLDRHFRKNNGEVGELEFRPKPFGQPGKVKFQTYINHANMGTCRLALHEMPVDPDVTLTRHPGTTKHGLGLDAEQELTPNGSIGRPRNELFESVRVKKAFCPPVLRFFLDKAIAPLVLREAE